MTQNAEQDLLSDLTPAQIREMKLAPVIDKIIRARRPSARLETRRCGDGRLTEFRIGALVEGATQSGWAKMDTRSPHGGPAFWSTRGRFRQCRTSRRAPGSCARPAAGAASMSISTNSPAGPAAISTMRVATCTGRPPAFTFLGHAFEGYRPR